jgi:hypothetical protein
MGDPYREPERYTRQSPFEHLADVRTPMLVIHGEQDFRVPVSEALRLWTDLRRHGVEGKLLYFPDENHWILPQNARLVRRSLAPRRPPAGRRSARRAPVGRLARRRSVAQTPVSTASRPARTAAASAA